MSVTLPQIDLFEIFEAGWSFRGQCQGHVFDARDVARLLVSDFWPPVLRGMENTVEIDVSMMSKAEAIVAVKQEIARRLAAAQAI